MVGCLSTDLGAKVPRKQQSYCGLGLEAGLLPSLTKTPVASTFPQTQQNNPAEALDTRLSSQPGILTHVFPSLPQCVSCTLKGWKTSNGGR